MGFPWRAVERALADARPARLSGKVSKVGSLTVEGTLPGARMGMLCRLTIRGQAEPVLAEIVALKEDSVTLMPLRDVSGVTVGAPIEPVHEFSNIPVGGDMVGRVLDGWGNPIDEGPPLRLIRRYPLHPPPLNPLEREPVEQALPVGICALDTLLTSGAGQRTVIMAGAGVGKSTLLGMMARHTDADVTVVALIGERSREVKRFVDKELGSGGLARAVVVASTSGMPTALRIRAAYVATAIAEFFRDQGKQVLFLMDSLSRVCQAQRELGLATGELPSTRGYPPSSFAIIPELLERAGTGKTGGAITGFYTALLQSDDLGDPIGDAIRAVADGHVVLDRKLADQGHYPAIDVLKSTSRVMSEIASPEHRMAALDVRSLVADLAEAEQALEMGLYERGKVVRFDRALVLAGEVKALLRQSPEVRSVFRESRDRLLALADRVRALKAKEEGEART